jgi:DNA-binding NtrC family response regulator
MPFLSLTTNRNIRRLLTALLEKAGRFCQAAENVAQAKRLLTETPFDLLITDIDMPGETGSDLIRPTPLPT